MFLHARQSLLLTLCLLALLSVPAWAENKSPVAKLDLQDGDSLVFLGDSITHQRLYTQYVEDFFYTRYPDMRIKFHNAGVGGAQAWDALQRFDRDVADYKPKYVTVLLGMNDGRYQHFNQDIWQTYHTDMTELVSRISEIGATPVLMTPTMYDSRAALARKRKPAENYNSVLTFYGTWLREVAQREGHGFVDMWGRLNNLTLQERKANADFTLIKDSVHPDAPGQLVMAYSIIDDMGLRGGISNIRVTVTPEGNVRIKGPGGKATEMTMEDGVLSFTWHAESLPWVVPPEAQLGAKLVKLGHRASREGFEVHGLKPGKYQLSIDGEVVGEYTDEQLARHIELQSNPKTPQYQQALKVAELNQVRNQGPIGKLRSEWSLFQRFARTRRQVEANPDDKQAAARLKEFESKMEGREDRIASYEKAALEIEDKIFEVNQPVAREYVLKPVKD